jgi:hypothetical protein
VKLVDTLDLGSSAARRGGSSPSTRTNLGVHMWTLVFIYFVAGNPESQLIGNYTTMYDCFDSREQLSYDVGGQEGYFPQGMQAVCINRNADDIL